MDPKLYALVVGIVATSAVITLLGGVFGFAIPPGFWVVLGGVVTLITTIVAGGNFRGRNNDPPGGDE